MKRQVAIVGGGPAGLMAAEQLAAVDGLQVTVFDAMPSPGRKFLMAGRGGLNITHAEPLPAFVDRYGERSPFIAPLLDAFGPQALREWIHGLGVDTFVGTSGRVFPREMKAAPLLRAWLHRLRGAGVQFRVRHRWLGWRDDGALRFAAPDGEQTLDPAAVLLALGGGSWARLGSDGAWVSLLGARGLPVRPLQPANCGFNVAWSPHFRERFAGAPVKAVTGACGRLSRQGEFNITAAGIEGGLVYALSAELRDSLARDGRAQLCLDLAPGRSLARLRQELAQPRGRDSLANHLRRRVGIDGVKAGLLREFCPPDALTAIDSLAAAIKSLPVPVVSPRPIDEAISSAGGVAFEAVDERLMARQHPGLFFAGEMLDWEAPTGGYLLTACLASGYVAGRGMAAWLREAG
ncbi:MAG: TIGR03862 family flavoprotein [Azonexaceae bacterium]|uniref:TIGR03862 family flavoprotein n=1 Tax=Azonexus sp. R2A61 TaxID=2744443 RepID=UPI001F41C584|nr:TIGR03862 family flavoprotein [Azonexus sp. R2A61]MCE1238299.1 TIGR03862 family flavoprotein [Azonexaceae bacterium]